MWWPSKGPIGSLGGDEVRPGKASTCPVQPAGRQALGANTSPLDGRSQLWPLLAQNRVEQLPGLEDGSGFGGRAARHRRLAFHGTSLWARQLREGKTSR